MAGANCSDGTATAYVGAYPTQVAVVTTSEVFPWNMSIDYRVNRWNCDGSSFVEGNAYCWDC
jgi:hypothetical protein